MKDGIIKGTGNSRNLKSNIASNTTWAQFLTMLLAGSLPIDLNGINADGWTQIGMALNKANLLSDSTTTAIMAALGITLSSDPTPNEVFAAYATALSTIVNSTRSTPVTTTAPVISLPSTVKESELSVLLSGNSLKNELNYNNVTWAEWGKTASVTTADATGMGQVIPPRLILGIRLNYF